MRVKIFNSSDLELPKYARKHDACLDLRAATNGEIYPGAIELVKTGIFTSIPIGYKALIYSRSGLALKHGIIVLNAPGVIDAYYRDEWKIILYNLSDVPFKYRKGDRMAQVSLEKVEVIQWEEVSKKENLDPGDRGGGFGSSGK